MFRSSSDSKAVQKINSLPGRMAMINPSAQMSAKLILAAFLLSLVYPNGEAIHKNRSIDMEARRTSETCCSQNKVIRILKKPDRLLILTAG